MLTEYINTFCSKQWQKKREKNLYASEERLFCLLFQGQKCNDSNTPDVELDNSNTSSYFDKFDLKELPTENTNVETGRQTPIIAHGNERIAR